MTTPIIQSLWIGDRLSTMEQLAISSFLHCGHEYHLYGYGQTQGLPEGAIWRDGREILPAESIFAYRSGFGAGSVSAFSNYFRFKLLAEHGGWWVDTDVVCLRPFNFQAPVVLGSEQLGPNEPGLIASSSVMKQPVEGDLAVWAWSECQRADKELLEWGQIGPRLVQRGVEVFDLHQDVRPPNCFSPVPWYSCEIFLDPNHHVDLTEDTFAVHLWHQMWKHHGFNPDGDHAAESLYERLKTRFLRA